jgi:uncharacterized protein (DUF1501 family)
MAAHGFDITRRHWLGLAGGALAAGALPVRVGFAAGAADRPLVLVLLRGGLDGLALLPIHGDPDYADRRSILALPPPGRVGGALDLDGRIGLHPAAGSLLRFWQTGRMAVAPAVGGPEFGGDHARARRLLAAGTPSAPETVESGWLARALAAAGQADAAPGAFAAAGELPEVLRGPAAAQAVPAMAWPRPMPAFYAKAAALYAEDPLFAGGLTAALSARENRARALGADHAAAGRMGARAQDFPFAAARVGARLAQQDGVGVAVIEVGGFDTHAGQGGLEGPLARRLAGLADGLSILAAALGGVWERSLIVAISEFGRSVAPNAQGGTDHGTAGAALVLGGAVEESAILGDVPPLTDFKPSLDPRALFKAVLRGHWQLSGSALNSRVFPDSGAVAPAEGLRIRG